MDFRLYFMTANGHIADSIAFQCSDEAEALQKAADHLDSGRDMELWNLDRRVKRFTVGEQTA